MRIAPAAAVDAEAVVPGDKSISHRALILGTLALGRSYVSNLSPAADVASTAACLLACGAAVRPFGDGRVALDGAGAGRSLRAPDSVLDCGNSGTTLRLLTGVLAGHDLEATLDGDQSLRRRPMERVAEPLRRMGAVVHLAESGTAPLTVRGRTPLHGIKHSLPVASAQLKSALMLAGLSADSPTTIVEPAPSRDHTERMLALCGVPVRVEGLRITLTPGPLQPFGLRIPGDLSSAGFLLALAAGRPGWRVRCPGVGLNPGRTGVLDVLRAMGAQVTVIESPAEAGAEPVGDVEVVGAPLRGTVIAGELVPRCIDELPVIAVLATQAEGTTEVRDAAELRLKESDRIASLAAGLRRLGARVEELTDGLVVEGPTSLRAAALDAHGDHRLAMAWAIAACLAGEDADTLITGVESVAVSYPGFFEDLRRITGG